MSGKQCPDIKACEFIVPRKYFETICNGNFEMCRIYCQKRKGLKTPMEWIQIFAIEQSEVEITHEPV